MPIRSLRRALPRAHALAGSLLFSLFLSLPPAEVSAGAQPPQTAQDASATTEAKDLYMRGTELYAKEQYAEALDALEQSYALVASPNSSLLIARCLRELKRHADAVRRYELAEAEARQRVEQGEPRYVPTAEAASREAKALRGALGTVSLVVTGAPAGSIIEMNGAKTRLPETGRLTLLSPPGEVAITLRPPSGEPIARTALVEKGADVSVEIAAAPVMTPPREKRDEALSQKPSRPWALPAALAAGGVGLAGAAMFLGFGVSSQSTFDRLKEECGTKCGARRDEVEAGQREQTAANVGLALGAIGIAAGGVFTVLWITDPGRGASPNAAERSMEIAVGLGEARLRGTF